MRRYAWSDRVPHSRDGIPPSSPRFAQSEDPRGARCGLRRGIVVVAAVEDLVLDVLIGVVGVSCGGFGLRKVETGLVF